MTIKPPSELFLTIIWVNGTTRPSLCMIHIEATYFFDISYPLKWGMSYSQKFITTKSFRLCRNCFSRKPPGHELARKPRWLPGQITNWTAVPIPSPWDWNAFIPVTRSSSTAPWLILEMRQSLRIYQVGLIPTINAKPSRLESRRLNKFSFSIDSRYAPNQLFSYSKP